jgi:hypothetical protein
MRRLSAALLLFAFASVLRAADVEFVRVWPAWRDAIAFERIGEYFGEPEHHWNQVVLRTRREARDGFYFLVRVKSGIADPGAHFEVSVILPNAPEPKAYALPAPLPTKETVFQLGLTGPDWPGGKDVHPVAWKVALLAADGRVLAEHKSFLWEKPAK